MLLALLLPMLLSMLYDVSLAVGYAVRFKKVQEGSKGSKRLQKAH